MIQSTIRAIHRIEEAFLALLVTVVVILGCTQITLRNLGSGAIWIDPAVRYGVLWIGFVAAGISTRKGRHISVDALSRALPPAVVHYTNIVTDVAAATVTSLLMLAGAATFLTPDSPILVPFALLVPDGPWEAFADLLVGEDGAAFTVTFAGRRLFDVPEWGATAIIPLGFGVMSLRFWTRAGIGITGGEVERAGEIDEAREAGHEAEAAATPDTIEITDPHDGEEEVLAETSLAPPEPDEDADAIPDDDSHISPKPREDSSAHEDLSVEDHGDPQEEDA